jgi:hypothetical protein
MPALTLPFPSAAHLLGIGQGTHPDFIIHHSAIPVAPLAAGALS